MRTIPYRPRLKTVCILCKQLHHAPDALCTPCAQLLSPLGPACSLCATPFTQLTESLLCGACIIQPPPIDNVHAAFRFEGVTRNLLHAFKYQAKLSLAYFLSKQMLKTTPSVLSKDACFVPIPIHKKRLHERGFNQAALLAKEYAKHYRLPCLHRGLYKVKNTTSQAKLNKSARKQNLNASFKISAPAYRHIILVDDLITTGQTAYTISKALKQQGVEQVSLWCIAKTCLT